MKRGERAIWTLVTALSIWGLCPVRGPAAPDAAGAPASASVATNQHVTVTWHDDMCSYKAGEWELRIHYLYRGTRSEGQLGGLYRGEDEVVPTEPGETVDTPIGKLKHYGAQRKQHWDITGWNFADKQRILRSEQVKTTP